MDRGYESIIYFINGAFKLLPKFCHWFNLSVSYGAFKNEVYFCVVLD